MKIIIIKADGKVLHEGTPAQLVKMGCVKRGKNWLPAETLPEGTQIEVESIKFNSLKSSVSLPAYQMQWVDQTSRANRNCGMSGVIQSLIMDQMDREAIIQAELDKMDAEKPVIIEEVV